MHKGDMQAKTQADYVGTMCFKHFPILTLHIVAVIVFVYYAPQDDFSRDTIERAFHYDADQPRWYSALTSVITHRSESHLLSSVASLTMLGTLLESTEGALTMTTIFWGSAVVGCGAHSVLSGDTTVAGASGGIYGLGAAQVAILVLNWSQVRYRYYSLFVIVSVVATEIITVSLGDNDGVSTESHLFGAMAGVLYGLVVVENLVLHQFELWIVWSAISLLCTTIIVYWVLGHWAVAWVLSVGMIPLLLHTLRHHTFECALRNKDLADGQATIRL